MGLRFRRSITLCKGVKLNFGKTGMSVSAGIPGFRQTYNLNTGKRTTTVGLPGTGIFYTTTSGSKHSSDQGNHYKSDYCSPHSCEQVRRHDAITIDNHTLNNSVDGSLAPAIPVPELFEARRLSASDIRDIYRLCDEKIDWFRLLSSREPTDSFFDHEMWDYLHSVAYKVCNGDIGTYLKLINEINPFDDLLDYLSNVECGEDESGTLCVSFAPKLDVLLKESDSELFSAACSIRIARDVFSLLPVEKIIIQYSGTSVGQIMNFDSKSFSKIIFSYSDPIEIVKHYRSSSSDM